ncbi:putative regulator of chromosome condensation -like protein [Eutypa lata UCREL1]|uniref:Putative regulator of chromosome condensation-like protein n=1 Tax=Eutypa lata (strain UCR-EL1) TaxID=1287681 RepID=M7TVS8_EUTLA|nr:putative regulator of chromosome condensation -like protein [Eutypa lata UCREL1]
MSGTGPSFMRNWRSRWLRQRSVLDERAEMDADSSDTQREPTRDYRRPAAAQRRARYTLEDITSAERELEDVDSELRALWDFTNASPDPYSELSFPSPPLQTQGNAEESRRVKRRKLDSDRLSAGFTGFRYGKYGQIEPGQLTMEIVRARRLYNIGLDDQNNDLRVAQIPSEFDISPAQCRVTIEYGEEETDDIDGLRDDARTPNRIGSLPFESETSDDEGNLEDFTLGGTVDFYGYRQRLHQIRSSGYAEAREAAQIATQEAVRAVGGELLAPDARFYIERDKSTCTMTFDPPVSGRFILLKMWSPHRDPTANIDIQAVSATGFAGPRFFPSVELR